MKIASGWMAAAVAVALAGQLGCQQDSASPPADVDSGILDVDHPADAADAGNAPDASDASDADASNGEAGSCPMFGTPACESSWPRISSYDLGSPDSPAYDTFDSTVQALCAQDAGSDPQWPRFVTTCAGGELEIVQYAGVDSANAWVFDAVTKRLIEVGQEVDGDTPTCSCSVTGVAVPSCLTTYVFGTPFPCGDAGLSQAGDAGSDAPSE